MEILREKSLQTLTIYYYATLKRNKNMADMKLS